MSIGTFYGIGVGPGPAGLIPVAALQALEHADVILAPRARNSANSVARQCLAGLAVPQDRFREVIYNMDTDRAETLEYYRQLADEIAFELHTGKNVAYLTIGDTLTYSTYSYTLQALLQLVPELKHKTFPGITSYAAIAAALDWPLGQGKERTLILPCPDTPDELRREIETHDIIILMKIGARLDMVRSVVSELGLEAECGFGSRIGLANEHVSNRLSELDESKGYLMTMLIRNNNKRANR